MTLETIAKAISQTGLQLRTACHANAADLAFLPENSRTILLLGFAGQNGWSDFAAAPEAQDGLPDPLDRWSKRIIGALASQLGAKALFPSDGPPFLPFQQLAKRAGEMFTSPLGLLIHPEFGLWHSFRGALVFARQFALPQNLPAQNPCETCAAKPCLTACPVGAFSAGGYNVNACAAHLHSKDEICTTQGCLARLACPVGAQHRYGSGQTAFYMAAFKAAHIAP